MSSFLLYRLQSKGKNKDESTTQEESPLSLQPPVVLQEPTTLIVKQPHTPDHVSTNEPFVTKEIPQPVESGAPPQMGESPSIKRQVMKDAR